MVLFYSSNCIIRYIGIKERIDVSKVFRKDINTAVFRNNDEPPKPMKLNDVQTFKIDYNQRKSCNLFDKHNKKVETYYVKKKDKGKIFKLRWQFYASVDEDFTQSEISDFKEKDDDQLGSVKCNKAVIDLVYVEGGEHDTRKARRCGIGTILSALCMIDEDVNPGDGIALNLDDHFRISGISLIEKVKKECKKVVGLQMAAAEGGGNTYFEAASQVGYNRFILFDYEQKEWVWSDVKEAQQCYNEKRIGFYKCTLYWYFCKEVVKSTKPPPVPPVPPGPPACWKFWKNWNCPKPKKE